MKFDVQDFYAAIRKEQDAVDLTGEISSHTWHYLNVFQKGELINWNWMAFLFAPIWMLYRRM